MVKDWNFDSEFVDKKTLVGSEFALSKNIEKVSIQELRDIKNKVNFYLEHFKILDKKGINQSADLKINLLRKMKHFLDGELTQRAKIKVY